MRFNIIIGNPPYQEMDGGGGVVESSLPLYNQFILDAMERNPNYITMIIPLRYMCGGKPSIDAFRNKIISCGKISKIITYQRCWDVFPNVDIPGGVQYFLYDSTYNSLDVEVINKQSTDIKLKRQLNKYKYIDSFGKDQYMVLIDNRATSIVDKVLSMNEVYMDTSVLPRTPFGLESYFEDSDEQTIDKCIKVHCSNNRVTYTSRNQITDSYNALDYYKIIVGKVNVDRGGNTNSDKFGVVSQPKLINPGEVCTTTFLVLFKTKELVEAQHFIEYIKTRFARFLAYVTLAGTSMSNRNYMFIPLLDFSKQWADAELYNRYRLSTDEIDYINSTIKEY